ncbi:MAG TPA: UDP-N-acetylmuramate--L-alanine ligase, partial [Telluria sp.]|nr:UDP-N-acetylmuramate--L-alanine ligase [Telluria sp.]
MKHKIKNIHFVGIGGSGMSGIAEVLINLGYNVSGSDLGSNAASQRLASLGAKITLGHDAANVVGADAVVTSTAVKEDNPEVVAARAAKTPIVPRAIMLGELMRLKRGIAIAGTHGKTTTTSLVASVLAEGGLDPTFVIGGRLNSAGANAKLGTGEYIVAEADESDASFLNLSPMIEVITNIDADHMETYEHDFEKLKSAFVHFTHRLPFYGRVMLCVDDAHVRAIIPHVTKPITTYGFSEEAEVRAVNARAIGLQMHFTVIQDGYPDTDFVLNQPGMHNVQNACSAIAIAREIGIEDSATQRGLAEFHGVGRRFTRYGEVAIPGGGSFTLVDDFGHHPIETEVTLAAARGAYPGRRLVLAFQPHRFSRTRDLFEDFVKVLGTPDVLVLSEVYAAGEAPVRAADGRSLAHALRVNGKVEPIFVEAIADMPETIMG